MTTGRINQVASLWRPQLSGTESLWVAHSLRLSESCIIRFELGSVSTTSLIVNITAQTWVLLFTANLNIWHRSRGVNMYVSSSFRLSVNRVNLSFTSHSQCSELRKIWTAYRSTHSRCLNYVCLELYTAVCYRRKVCTSAALSHERSPLR